MAWKQKCYVFKTGIGAWGFAWSILTMRSQSVCLKFPSSGCQGRQEFMWHNNWLSISSVIWWLACLRRNVSSSLCLACTGEREFPMIDTHLATHPRDSPRRMRAASRPFPGGEWAETGACVPARDEGRFWCPCCVPVQATRCSNEKDGKQGLIRRNLSWGAPPSVSLYYYYFTTHDP